MTIKYFVEPFAFSGIVAPVPDAAQLNNTLSYEKGFTSQYALIQSDPASINVPLDQFNQILNDITSAIQNIQQFGIPYFITDTRNGGAAFGYAKHALCYQPADNNVYQSTITNNTNVPPGTGWQLFGVSTSLYINFVPDTGAANAYVIAPSPAIATLVDGLVAVIKPTLANTGASTLDIGTGAEPIVTMKNQALAAGMITPIGMHFAIYNATLSAWVLVNPALGTAAYLDAGTAPHNVVQLNASSELPAVSAKNLTHVPLGSPNSGTVALVSGGATLFSHSLGAVPTYFEAWLVCTTTEMGYAVGDRIRLSGNTYPGGGGGTLFYETLYADATNVGYLYSLLTPYIMNKTTLAPARLTATFWSVEFHAWP